MLFVVLLVRPSRSAREAFDAILGEVTFFAILSLLDLMDPVFLIRRLNLQCRSSGSKRDVKETRMDCLWTNWRISAIFGFLSLKWSRTIRSFELGFALAGEALFSYEDSKKM